MPCPRMRSFFLRAFCSMSIFLNLFKPFSVCMMSSTHVVSSHWMEAIVLHRAATVSLFCFRVSSLGWHTSREFGYVCARNFSISLSCQ